LEKLKEWKHVVDKKDKTGQHYNESQKFEPD